MEFRRSSRLAARPSTFSLFFLSLSAQSQELFGILSSSRRSVGYLWVPDAKGERGWQWWTDLSLPRLHHWGKCGFVQQRARWRRNRRLFIWWRWGSIDGRPTQHTATARWLIVLFKRGYRKSLFEYTWSSLCVLCLFCCISRHCFGLPLHSLYKQNLYLCSTKSPSVFGKSGLAASLIKGRIYRVGTRQNLGQIWLNGEGNIFF